MIKLVFLSLIIFLPVKSLETFVVLKVNNEIITNIDIENEIRYLVALNNELKDTSKITLNNLAKESLIREKIKEDEVLKFYKFNNTQEYLNAVLKNYYERLGISSLENFKQYLKNYNLELDVVKKKIEIELLWNNLVGAKYKNQINVNKETLKKRIVENFSVNELVLEYELSEIIFQTKSESEMKNKIDTIKKEISNQGFKNAANLHSISETSKFGGDLGWISEKQLSEKIINTLKNLSVNDVTDPIKITNGFMILKINNIREKKIENDQEKLLQELIISETNRKYNQFSIIYYNKLKLNTEISE
jgi:peptidyl-prolyl cis-trans isomerase SurA